MSADVNERAIVVDVIVVVVVVETKMITNKHKKKVPTGHAPPASRCFVSSCVTPTVTHTVTPPRYPPLPFDYVSSDLFFCLLYERRRLCSPIDVDNRCPPPHSLLQPLPDQLFGFIVDCTLPSFASVVVFSSLFRCSVSSSAYASVRVDVVVSRHCHRTGSDSISILRPLFRFWFCAGIKHRSVFCQSARALGLCFMKRS